MRIRINPQELVLSGDPQDRSRRIRVLVLNLPIRAVQKTNQHPSLPPHNPLLPGIHCRLGAVGQVQLAQDVADVGAHSPIADH